MPWKSWNGESWGIWYTACSSNEKIWKGKVVWEGAGADASGSAQH